MVVFMIICCDVVRLLGKFELWGRLLDFKNETPVADGGCCQRQRAALE
jgi:hypothetical protein